MAVPGFQEFMLPLLRFTADRNIYSLKEAREYLARVLNLTESDQAQLLNSGTQSVFVNRVSWAAVYLAKCLLLEKPSRGKYRITERGLAVLEKDPARIDVLFLQQFPEFQVFKSKKDTNSDETDRREPVGGEEATIPPNERLDAAYRELRVNLADELLRQIRNQSDKFFEQLVVDLLRSMGYGGSPGGDARVVGKSGDGGIDGVIKEDRLGLDMVYIQAKRWQNSVGPDEIRKFVGSLGEQRANKGVFITSGDFTSGARQAASRANAKVVLINGDQLVDLMIDHGVGVSADQTYVVKKIDSDYFAEE